MSPTVARRRRAGTGLLALAFTGLAAGGAVGAATSAASGAGAPSTICIGIVVRYGDVKPPAASPRGGANTFCATVRPGATGAEVLDLRARALHTPPPRYQQGLLCAIDGYPARGCGEPTATGGFRYWSYWHRAPGQNAWTYSNVGADSFRPANGAQEGWSWVAGESEATAPPPPVLAFDAVCATTGATRAPSPAPVPAATSLVAAAPASGNGSGPPVGVLAGAGLIAVVGGLSWRAVRRR